MKTRLLSVSGRLAVPALLALFALGAARAEEGDPPGRVARLSDIEGSVSLQPAGVQDWAAATVNRPLTTGDKLWTDQNSRAELDIGAAAIRLGATTGFSVLNLDDHTAQMQVTAGTLIVRVRDLEGNQTYEVDTPNIALSLQQPGEYRVEVNDAGDTTVVKVSEGQAQAAGAGQSVAIGTQQRVTFTGTNTLSVESASLGAPDDLDGWSAGRERQLHDSPSRQYVADDVAGTQDLDTNGRWEQTPDYGYVWTPTVVVAGWAPYRFGHWVWIAPWGWTWVDDAPWGYAPFHYGRWVEWNSAWCWVPGPRHLRPVYAPALVAWVGGPGGGVAVGVGANVGWFPLAPREVYVPGYHVSPNYVRNVNITNTTIVNNTYITNVYQNNVTNIHYVNNTAGAVTAVPQNVFTSGQRVGGHVVRLPAAALAGAAVTSAPPRIVPRRQSVLGANAGRSVARPPAALLSRPVVARTPPPRAPVPFDRQVAAIQQNGGRPLARAELARLQPATPVAPVRVIAGGAAAVRAGAPAHGPDGARPGNSATATRPGSSAPAPSAGGQAPSFADRERVLQNNRLTPPRESARPPAAAPVAQAPAPSQAAAPQSRTDRPPAAQQHLPPTQQQGFSPDDPTHAHSRPPSAPVNRPPAPASAASGSSNPRPQEPRYQERYRPPAPAAAPPPAPVREAPSSAPVSRPQERSAPLPVSRPQERSAPLPASRPQERSAPPPARAPEPKSEPRSESRDSGPHADRTSRDRAER